jgi:hypothetical protein
VAQLVGGQERRFGVREVAAATVQITAGVEDLRCRVRVVVQQLLAGPRRLPDGLRPGATEVAQLDAV